MNKLFIFLAISVLTSMNTFAQKTTSWNIKCKTNCSKEAISKYLLSNISSDCRGYRAFSVTKESSIGFTLNCSNQGTNSDYPVIVQCESTSNKSDLEYCGKNRCSQIQGFHSASLGYSIDKSKGFDNTFLIGLFYCW